MQEHLDELGKLRTEIFELKDPTPIESALKEYYDYIKTKRNLRDKNVSSVTMAGRILVNVKGERKFSICLFLALSLREVDKKKTNNHQHLRKCYESLAYLQKARDVSARATENEKILFAKVERIVSLLVAVQCPPEEY